MIYEYALTIPKATTKTQPTRIIADLSPGTITHVELEFPWGCMGLVGIQIYHWDVKLWPVNQEQYFISHDHVITFGPDFRLLESPYQLGIRGYNEDDTYSHTIRCRFNVLARGETLAEKLLRLFTIGG